MRTSVLKAIIKTKPGVGLEVLDIPYPQLSSDTVIIKTLACGICGADLEVYSGRLSKFAKLPMVLGHEITGEIVELGEDVSNFTIGDKVVAQPFTGMCGHCYYCKIGQPWSCSSRHMIGGMAEYVAVPSRNLYSIPDNLTPLDAALCEPLAVALHAVHISNFKSAYTAAVLGPGPIGLLTALMLKHAGATQIIVTGTQADVSPRLETASEVADITINIDVDDPIPIVQKVTNKLGVDIVFDTTGSQRASPQGIEMLKTKGTLVVIGHYPETMALKDPSYKGYTIIGNVSYDWETWERLIPYLQQRPVNLRKFISHILPLYQAVKGFELANSKQSLKVVFQPALS
jgi:L-iditol 2-dehydrogenase